ATPERAAAALKGLRAYQTATRAPALDTMPVVARAGRATVRDYGGHGPRILFVPSLINPPDVLDLDHDRSLLRWLATQGVRPLLLDWGHPTDDERDLSVAGHVEAMLLPLLDAIGGPVTLAGYCLGGTMALAAAARRPVSGLALIATPWRFGCYSAGMRASLRELWDHAHPACAAIGMMPMEVLQAAFWRADPARTVDKYAQFGTLDPADPAARTFVRLEDWANDGPPLTYGAARELFEGMFADDRPGQGLWRVAGAEIDAAALPIPTIEITSTRDRIVPEATTPGIGEQRNLALGHVGMVIGGKAREALWEPLAAWLSRMPAS
ncbi:alpha/beta fold hydrolase, partial [Sphingomonas sp.]|uniref:alpha/beta fold hydrolase n=1 Tax=Sphingomonas sp. TaxID=28214 RepID=UPI003B3B2709